MKSTLNVVSWIIVLGINLLHTECSAVDTVCTIGSNKYVLSDCLRELKEKLLDPDIFWFGNSYTTRCKDNTDVTLCTNPDPSKTSIATRVFSSVSPLQSIDRFLELRFESSGKNYNGCGNQFRTTETWRLSVDPLSDTIVYPWYVRHLPSVKWDHQDGDMFTMIVYDVGFSIIHGVFINIPRDDLSNAQVIRSYHGPLIPTDYHNPYVFLLYKQSGNLVLSDKWNNTFNPDPSSNTWNTPQWSFEEMASDLNLIGPVGLNFIVATGDEYAAGLMYSREYLAMCPVYTSRALRSETRPFIPSDVLLNVWIDFNFTNEMMKFSVCCKQYTYPTRDFSLNPLGNPIYHTAEVRTDNPRSVSFRRMGTYSSSQNFTGKTYTLIGFDPDVPKSAVGTPSRPLLHEMVTNIVNGDIRTGHMGLEYSGPNPPDTVHTYYFFLYEQESPLNATELMMNYSGNTCYGSLVGRCLFDINQAVTKNNLTLVGATWFRAATDPYVQKRRVDSGVTEADECRGEPNYPKICGTSGANIITTSAFIVVIITFFRWIICDI
ncbi:hypothetical protein ACF0H5_017910 [Mactra antiquata]